MSKESSPQANYRLGKTFIQSTPISATYNIQNSLTQQIWKAKVFDLTKIDQYDILNAVEYNQEVFIFLKDKYENSLYLEKTFQKDANEFLVFQYWNERLSDFINKNPEGVKDQQQVKKILQDVLMSICDIYAESYMILNLRPEQIVRVQSPTENSLGWKIESLVFEYTTHGLPQQCEYEFDYAWASNEQKSEKQNLDDSLKDQQIVWYMGILALRLIYGPKFKINDKFKDSDLKLNQIKRIALPQVYDLIDKAVKANLKDRIPLKKFLNLPVFSKVQISNEVKEKFISGNSERIKKSTILKGSILHKSTIRKNSDSYKMTVSSRIQSPMTSIKDHSITRMKNTLQNPYLSEVKAQKIFNELRWGLEKCLYLAEIKDYTQTSASLNDASVEDKTLVRYLFFKIAEINLERFNNLIKNDQNLKIFRQSANSKEMYEQLLQVIEQNAKSKQMKSILEEATGYENKMRKLDPNQLKILQDFKYIATHIKKSIENKKANIQQAADYFAIVTGKFFQTLKKSIESASEIQNKGIKKRALCYFIISCYVVLAKPTVPEDEQELPFLLKNDFLIYKQRFYDPQKLQGSIHVKFDDQIDYIRLCEFTKIAQEKTLIENSQLLLGKYFQTVPTDSKPLAVLEKQTKIRTSLHVPDRPKY